MENAGKTSKREEDFNLLKPKKIMDRISTIFQRSFTVITTDLLIKLKLLIPSGIKMATNRKYSI